MKLTTSLTLTSQYKQCQFGVAAEIDEKAGIDQIRTQTNKAMAALEVAVNGVVTMRSLDNAQEPPKPQQLPNDPASPKQIKYLNDLTSKCGTTLGRWCKEHGVSKDEITAKHCKEWIPELLEKNQMQPKFRTRTSGDGFFDD